MPINVKLFWTDWKNFIFIWVDDENENKMVCIIVFSRVFSSSRRTWWNIHYWCISTSFWKIFSVIDTIIKQNIYSGNSVKMLFRNNCHKIPSRCSICWFSVCNTGLECFNQASTLMNAEALETNIHTTLLFRNGQTNMSFSQFTGFVCKIHRCTANVNSVIRFLNIFNHQSSIFNPIFFIGSNLERTKAYCKRCQMSIFIPKYTIEKCHTKSPLRSQSTSGAGRPLTSHLTW